MSKNTGWKINVFYSDCPWAGVEPPEECGQDGFITCQHPLAGPTLCRQDVCPIKCGCFPLGGIGWHVRLPSGEGCDFHGIELPDEKSREEGTGTVDSICSHEGTTTGICDKNDCPIKCRCEDKKP